MFVVLNAFPKFVLFAAATLLAAPDMAVLGDPSEHDDLLLEGWTDVYVPYNLDAYDGELTEDDFGPNGDYDSNDPLRQHLHLYQYEDPSGEASPVYFYAHGNGGDAADGLINPRFFGHAGYSLISWESVTYLVNDDDNESLYTCWADFQLVWKWFQDNADSYNLDPNSVIIGGRSRGTVCSWPLAHNTSLSDEIKGIYMFNALPDGVWGDETDDADYFWTTNCTSVDSPPAMLVYGADCPTDPPQQDCIPDPPDGHNPRHGQKIVDAYNDLGIGDKIKLIDGVAKADWVLDEWVETPLDVYGCFPHFAYVLQGQTPPLWANELCRNATA